MHGLRFVFPSQREAIGSEVIHYLSVVQFGVVENRTGNRRHYSHHEIIPLTLSVVATVVIWSTSLAVTQQLNAVRNVEDQISALSLSERAITSPAVWGEVLGKLGKQEIDRLFEQQGSKDLLIEATETLLYNAIVEYRNTLREKQATAKTINNSLQALGQAFILDVLVDFDALENSVPAIAEAFVEDLEQG